MKSASVARQSAFLSYPILLVALVATLLLAPAARAGTVVADTGFRPGVNGFSFENYGGGDYKNLDVAEVQKIFGRAACISGKGATCVLNPGVRNWMNTINGYMDGGHCYGFSALAQYIYNGQLPRFGYSSLAAFGGGPNPFDLGIENGRLQRSIARSFAFQILPSVNSQSVRGTPNRVLRHLIDNLENSSGEAWNLMIFQWGMQAGHAITPYAVERMGDGIFHIHVYDNNWPDDANRRVIVNTRKNTWRYRSSINPNVTEADYVGNARSNSLFLRPNKPALGIQPCTACYGRQGAHSRFNQITLSGTADEHARLLITDSKGRQTGNLGGRLINQIPGAKILPQASSPIKFAADGTIETISDSPEPVYLIPKGLKVRIRIDGRDMTVRDRESLGVVGPTFDSTVENLKMGPGKVAYATLAPKKQTLSITGASGESSPKVTFGAQSSRAAYRIKASALGAAPRSTFFFAKKQRYRLLRIGKKASGPQDWKVVINKVSAQGETRFVRNYRLRGNQVAFLYYGPLAAGKRAYVVIASANGDRVKLLKLREVRAKG